MIASPLSPTSPLSPNEKEEQMKSTMITSPSEKRHSCRFLFAALAALTSATLPAAVPNVTGVAMSQANDRLVTITYTLSDAPAVVTIDVQTNAAANAASDDPGWTSIGGEAIWNALGDVWRRVEPGSRTITWHPDHSWPDHKIEGNRTRAVVTAWALENTPDYMVVDLAAENVVRYYPAVDFLPKKNFDQAGAAVTNNPDYKTSKLLMRKIMARGFECTMGSTEVETLRDATREAPHFVSFSNNFYIGVFELTQEQWRNVMTTNTSATANFTVQTEMRPMEKVSYNEIRLRSKSGAASSEEVARYSWPSNPAPASFLGRLNSKTGLDFDLPSEAQWEFAARAGHGPGYLNDGSRVCNTSRGSNVDIKRLARFSGNPTFTTEPTTPPDIGGTAIVGSHAPSDWGLYDMHGNVYEVCLDWYQADLSSSDGTVNIKLSDPSKTLDGTAGSTRAARGGGFDADAYKCRASYRFGNSTATGYYSVGFRVVCTAGLR